MFTEPPTVEDTPRTYRSDLSTARMHTKHQTEPDKILLTAQDTMDALKKSGKVTETEGLKVEKLQKLKV